MVRVSVEDGRVLQELPLTSLVSINPQIDPLGIRQVDSADRSSWANDPFHVNDVDPLPARLAHSYPQFVAGDLLLSVRSINLVAVVDPATGHMKWWLQGLTRRQHDPDWNERGTITIFDNNMHRDFSRIYEVDPKSYEANVVLPGEPHDFYTWRRGKHDGLPGGGYLVTSSEQGRVFETDGMGKIVFDFINRYDGSGRHLVLSEARFFSTDYFEELAQCEE
jgi:hypothetical protein